MGQTGASVSPMSNRGRNTYVRTHITATLLQLLRERPLEAISISEICSRAGVGRASFYRNFASKEAVLEERVHELFQDWANTSEGGAGVASAPLSELLRSLFARFEKHRDFYALLNERGLMFLVKDAVIELFGPKPEQPKEEAYARAYFAYALYGWIEVWFQRGMRESAEEIAEMFQRQGL